MGSIRHKWSFLRPHGPRYSDFKEQPLPAHACARSAKRESLSSPFIDSKVLRLTLSSLLLISSRQNRTEHSFTLAPAGLASTSPSSPAPITRPPSAPPSIGLFPMGSPTARVDGLLAVSLAPSGKTPGQ